MTVLLDTNTVIWAGLGGQRLSQQAKTIVADRGNRRLVSAASAWEIATKVRIRKLDEAQALEADFVALMEVAGFELLSISASHALRAGRLTGQHKDPWDRMLAAQALALDIPIVSSDALLDDFGVRRIWK